MTLRKYALAAAFALTFIGSAGYAQAFTVEVLVHNGTTEIFCTGAQCNLACRDLEGIEVLQSSTFYSVGQTCTITITDGLLHSEAIETVLAFLSTAPIPEAGRPTDTGVTNPPGLINNENPNQPPTPPTSLNAPPGLPGEGTPPGQL